MFLTILIITFSSLLFAPLSNIMLWKKYTNFTDGLAHASIMSAVISALFGFNIIVGASINTLIFILLLYSLKSKNDNNLIVTIISIFIMSLGLILKKTYNLDVSLKKVLFGDIKLATYYDLAYISLLILISYPILYFNFNAIVLTSLNKDLAISKGVKVKFIEIMLLFLISLTIGICLKLIGSFMLFGILIIPPTTARLFSRSPKEMIIITIFISTLTSVISLILAQVLMMDMSPLLICINFSLFVIAKIITKITKYT
jgi:zinc transport system permease protein